MKKTVRTAATFLLTITLAMGTVQYAYAGGHHGGHNGGYHGGYSHHGGHYSHYSHHNDYWDAAGAFFVGALGVAVLANALSDPYPSGYYTQTTYVTPYYPPANAYRGEIVTYVNPPPQRVWVPGGYVEVPETVWVEGGYQQEWVQPVYDWVWTDGGKQYVMVQAGFYRQIWVPGYYTTRTVRKWVEGYWQ
jgi:hypothetical protein